eukprot:TRINITY_DN4966_c0_g1_i3.p1 TRINITY_DN4966_c0_g1~~TRINITY_DN4966_c0_g1_i3.p1  ORF type:complete len:187 (-),score=43.32 TRINITY_DN4966_c0_g1_i3:195-755(-)
MCIRDRCLISAVAMRKPEYFVWNVVVPMLAINGMALGSFVVDKTEPADRLSVSLTMVLTAVAFKLQISSSLPELPYLTSLDKFVLSSFLFITAVVLQNILSTEMTEDEDDICKWVFVSVFGACALGYLVHLLQWRVRRKHILASVGMEGGHLVNLSNGIEACTTDLGAGKIYPEKADQSPAVAPTS